MNMVAECTITIYQVLKKRRGEEGEGYEVRETADRGGARMGRVEDL